MTNILVLQRQDRQVVLSLGPYDNSVVHDVSVALTATTDAHRYEVRLVPVLLRPRRSPQTSR